VSFIDIVDAEIEKLAAAFVDRVGLILEVQNQLMHPVARAGPSF
jgi:hypothetical protein